MSHFQRANRQRRMNAMSCALDEFGCEIAWLKGGLIGSGATGTDPIARRVIAQDAPPVLFG